MMASNSVVSKTNWNVTDLSQLPADFSLAFFKDVEISLRCRQTGFKYFSEGYIHNVNMYKSDENILNVAAKCYRSQRKSESPHLVHIDISVDKIEFANCSCTAGLSGSCSHIIGLAHALCQWQLMGLSEPPADLASTSLPQQWGVPRGSKIEAVPSPRMVIVKPKETRKRKPVRNILTDNRKIRVKDEDISYLNSLIGYPISYLAHHSSCMLNTHLGNVPLCSALYTQAEFYNSEEIVPVNTVCGNLSFPKDAPCVLKEEYKILIDPITVEQTYKIEQSTRQQADSVEWRNQRRSRLTASNFYKIVKRKAKVTEKFINNLLQPKEFTSAATSHGKSCELKAREKYVSVTSHHVHDSGLVVNYRYPFIGATPDGKVCDNGVTGIVEIKCPFTFRNNTINEACQNNSFCLHLTENGVRLKEDHDYYIQVQGQLLVTGAPFCDFVVYTRKDIHIERIYQNNTFMQNVLDKLSVFYFTHIKERN